MFDLTMRQIDKKKSVLYRRIYRGPLALERHLAAVIKPPYDAVIVFKFAQHELTVEESSQHLEILHLLFTELSEQAGGGAPPLRLIRLLEGDWFMEVCAGIGALGGAAGVVALIRELLKDRALSRVTWRAKTVAVPAGGGMMRRKVHKYQSKESIEKLGDYPLQGVAEVYESDMDFIEFYDSDGGVAHVVVRED